MEHSTLNQFTQTDPVIILPIDISKSEPLSDHHSPRKQASIISDKYDLPPDHHSIENNVANINELYELEDESAYERRSEPKKKPLTLFRPIYILKESRNIYDNEVWEVGDEFEFISDVLDDPNQISLTHLRTSTNVLLDRSLVELDENTPLRLGIRDRGTTECCLLNCDALYSYLIHRSDQDETMYILSVNQHHITKEAFVSHYFICINKENTCFYLEHERRLRHCFFPTLRQLAHDARVHEFIPLSKPIDRNLTITEDELWQIDYKQLIIGPKIGVGEYGEVMSGKWKRNGPFVMVDVAIKRLKLNNVASNEFAEEVRAMKLLRNNYLVLLLGISTNPITNEKLIITELMKDGDLKSWLEKQEKLPSDDVLIKYCHQICLGMLHLERSNYIHRDLACRNVLLAADRVKITDFGMTVISEADPYYVASNTEQAIGKVAYRWTAPEIFAGKSCTTRSDVWSFGICMIELWSKGGLPYPTIKHLKELVKKINQGYVHDRPPQCPANYYEIIKSCLVMDPECRSSFKKLTDSFKLLLTSKNEKDVNLKLKPSRDIRLYYNTKEKEASVYNTTHNVDQKQKSSIIIEDDYIYAGALSSDRPEHLTTADDDSLYEAIPQCNSSKANSLSINNYCSSDSFDRDNEEYVNMSPSHLTKPEMNNDVDVPVESPYEVQSSIVSNLVESSDTMATLDDITNKDNTDETEQDIVSTIF